MQRCLQILVLITQIGSLFNQRHCNLLPKHWISAKHLHQYMHWSIPLFINLVQVLCVVGIRLILHHPEQFNGSLELLVGHRHMKGRPILHGALLQADARLV